MRLCALFIEGHAPKKQGGVRELTPHGTGLWLRWPEFGRDDLFAFEYEDFKLRGYQAHDRIAAPIAV